MPLDEPRFADMRNLADISSHRLREIENFFQTYKLLQDGAIELGGWVDRRAALKTIGEAKHGFRESRTEHRGTG